MRSILIYRRRRLQSFARGSRVWWTQRAATDLALGKTVQPLIENTIKEVRANNLFRWLREFGADFG
ncbi:hypothetical protein, partial [Bradyrhizobium sp.]|uniref:hypothetical protein n=1 Tax=Bradyrhizobium sp. TaxID=376 RepID=UPI003C754098